MHRCALTLLAVTLWSLAPLLVRADEPPPASPEALEFFEKQVRPVLAEKCYSCHGEKKQQAGLRLDSREAVLKGSDSGQVVTVGQPKANPLVEAIGHSADIKMPPDARLPDEQIAALTRWIEIGLPWPKQTAPAAVATNPDAWRSHWAFQPIARPAVPVVRDAAWAHSPVDAFIAAKLEAAGLTPSAPLEKRRLLRRVSVDLIGLPPSQAESDAFVADTAPDAFSKVVDRLLGSSHYGERWGRYWLDIARYADTKGYVFEEDRKYPFAYVYRDWVIRSLNDDLPYDQFLVQQIAADRLPLLDNKVPLQAMGFLTNGRRFLNNPHDIIDDRLDVLCRGTMALTVTCARCHDHKFDPIPSADYYSLYGVLASSHEPKEPAGVMTLADNPTPHNPRVFLRGSPGNQGPEVPRQFLAVLSGDRREPFKNGSGRLELAQAIASPTNPLTARVIINRLWAYHFGVPLVLTPSDFGVRTPPPSHSELLDYLAGRLIDEGWSLKKLHRLMVLSNTYQQQSDDRPECRAVDSENTLVWRMNKRRLDFEAMRDGVLAVSGQLDATIGGPAVELAKPLSKRRTVYGLIDRQNLPGMFRTFDFASPDTHSPQRFTTTVPQQALFMMNSPLMIEAARALAVRSESGGAADSGTERVARLVKLAVGREPTSEERSLLADYVRHEVDADAARAAAARWQYGYGEVEGSSGRIKSFARLPHFSGRAWQGGANQPDAALDWVNWHAEGGHPGHDPQHAAILRWTSPVDATVAVSGTLVHPHAQGDGVEGLVVSSRHGVVGSWICKEQRVETTVERCEVRGGDTLDFVVNPRGDDGFDSYGWAPVIGVVTGDVQPRQWNARAEFHGPPPAELGVWERVAQVLLMSNEFMFVD